MSESDECQPGPDRFRALRQWVRAPYRVAATLEIVGTTPKGHGLAVVTREANAYGVSVECAQRAIEGANVIIRLRGPDGAALAVEAFVARALPVPGGGYELSIVFEKEQPRLSVARIDLAA